MQHFGTEMIAQANAMEAEGISTRRTVERLRVMFPDEAIPDQHSVSNWRRKLLESSHEVLEENEVRIALRCDELVEQKLDWSAQHIDKARLAELIMGAGVYRDKGFKRHEKPAPGVQNIQINFIVEEQTVE